MPGLTFQEKLERLRQLGDLQGEMAAKAAHYAARDVPDLALRFQRASYAAVNARLFIQSALMAEREAGVRGTMAERPKAIRYDTDLDDVADAL
jgi:hypothetical protein